MCRVVFSSSSAEAKFGKTIKLAMTPAEDLKNSRRRRTSLFSIFGFVADRVVAGCVGMARLGINADPKPMVAAQVTIETLKMVDRGRILPFCFVEYVLSIAVVNLAMLLLLLCLLDWIFKWHHWVLPEIPMCVVFAHTFC